VSERGPSAISPRHDHAAKGRDSAIRRGPPRPNVVTVHEVGTAAGRDFVAMELIHGETLAEWLRTSQRTLAAILDVFLAAGRGLAPSWRAQSNRVARIRASSAVASSAPSTMNTRTPAVRTNTRPPSGRATPASGRLVSAPGNRARRVAT
jgi:hypothetical protein